jgi:hypothetical protein
MFGQNCEVQKPVPENGTQKLLQARHIRGDFLFACHQLPSSAGRMAEDFGFLDLDCGVNKSAGIIGQG